MRGEIKKEKKVANNTQTYTCKQIENIIRHIQIYILHTLT